ncbi:MAG TPA: hypothetical protein VHQ64_14680, partial [Pyrinomonadaceae bacterium]|nr:hypothetical protein [Pyrinomonadaceae bacterium]
MFRLPRIFFATLFVFAAVIAVAAQQTKSFTPVDGANLKAKIDSATVQGKANAPMGLFWVGYQFEVRPNVAVDFEIVTPDGTVNWSNDGWSIMNDPQYETHELGVFLLFEKALDRFTRA